MVESKLHIYCDNKSLRYSTITDVDIYTVFSSHRSDDIMHHTEIRVQLWQTCHKIDFTPLSIVQFQTRLQFSFFLHLPVDTGSLSYYSVITSCRHNSTVLTVLYCTMFNCPYCMYTVQ